MFDQGMAASRAPQIDARESGMEVLGLWEVGWGQMSGQGGQGPGARRSRLHSSCVMLFDAADCELCEPSRAGCRWGIDPQDGGKAGAILSSPVWVASRSSC